MHDAIYLDAIKRLVSRTKIIGTCYVWTGATGENGYGRISYQGKSVQTHRLAAHLFRDVPLAYDRSWGICLYTLHKNIICDHRACWNPEHTYEGTAADNMLDTRVMNALLPEERKQDRKEKKRLKRAGFVGQLLDGLE